MNEIVRATPPVDSGGALAPQTQPLTPVAEGHYPSAQGTFANEPEGLAQTLAELRRVFIKRKWVILSVATLTIVVGLLRALIEVPLYAATVRLQIDRNVVKVVEGGSTTPVETNDSEFLKTQYELLMSRAIAERVVASLQLGTDETFLSSHSSGGFSALKRLLRPHVPTMRTIAESDQTQKKAIKIVVGGRTVRPVAGSRMIDLTFQDPDPNRAQQIAMALADAFIASNIDKRFQANSFAKTFLEEQLAQLKIKLEAAEKAMLDFAEREKIVVVTERASIAENNLTTANAALSTLVQERVKNEELWKQVETTSGMNLPQFLSNASIETMRAKRSALVTDYQQKLETFKPSFPAMVQITNQIKDLDRQLAAEVTAIKASLKAAYESSVSQEQETRKHVDEYKAELLDLQKRSVQYNLLKREADTTHTLYDSLLQRYKEVDVASGVGANNVFVVDKAEVPGAPVSPNIPQALAMAIALGLGLGLGSAYMLEYTDDAVRSAAAVEQVLGLPVLGIIPKPAPRTSVEEELLEVSSAISESYRSLGTALMLSTERGLPKSIVITSSGPAEGKSSSAAALARHYASVGLKVLLVDADMRNPSLHKKLGTDNGVGFSTYLTGACSPPEAFKATSIGNLAFMSSGPLPPNAADLLSGQRLMSLLSVGGEIFDCIILDGPPTLGMADAQLLSNAAAATLLIVSAGETKAGLLTGALKRLRLARGRVIGAVLTKYDARSTGYEYGYGYGYGYSSRYGYGARGREVDQKLPGVIEDQSRPSS